MLSWGIAATGGIARTVGRVIAAEPGMRVAAVGSRDAGRAGALAAELDAPRAYGSYAELVLDPEVEAVYVATPHSLHLQVAELAIAAGKAVLCEKPLALTATEAERMVKLAREAGVFLMEAMWMRFNPLVRRVRALVRDGGFGEVRSVAASFGFPAPYDPAHRLWDPALGGGALLDLGIYPMGLAQFLLGEPDAMTATGSLSADGVDAEAGLLLSWNDGARALLDTSLLSPLSNAATVTGTTLRAELTSPFFATRRLVLHGPSGEPEEHVIGEADNGYAGEIREVRDALAEGRAESEIMPLDDTIAMARLLDRAREQVTRFAAPPSGVPARE
ncbi:oxidoreductase [Sphaerisporangium melleum]|uniref:Oxidoreductase n=1 Tax=Sphaerisporangium melleum TaxID=321316 RepID=A0A917RJL9_9ACTN|nr:Gfo/Idh/MocA family oxidoreductase [Sphaerisporangium melleum]GGL09740.1 oxidoreductase [Sphaerisporangium melleum]GII67596.1 oxidoreductase [Sphaerisporangium melleum]